MSRQFKVIVADDEKLIANNIARRVEDSSEAFRVIARAGSGTEALEQARELLPDVVFSDIKMPEMDGIELISKLRKEHPEILCVIVSGYSDFEYMKAAIQNSAVDYLLKPVNPEELHRLLQKLEATLLAREQQVIPRRESDAAALAESVAGVSKGTSSSVFITIGTGIGSGIIIGGRIWNGFHGIGGELGHVILDLNGVPCTCGNRGCLERYCSATALIRMGREAVEAHPESMILQMAGGDPANIEARTVIDSARQNDPTAVHVYGEYIDYLSQAIASVVNLLDPEVIVIGGGVSKAGDFLLDPLHREYPKYVIFNDQPMPEIKLAVLGAKAGMIGAAMLS